MRLLLAGALAAVTAAGLATIRPALLTDEERSAASTIRENRLHADLRFLSSEELRLPSPRTGDDRLTREYLASRFEAIGLSPGAPGGGWEQALEVGGVPAVVGRIRGRDPVLSAEAIVYRARRDRPASGLATMLAVAEAFVALPQRPRRSIYFAAVEAAEGPPGSVRLTGSPTVGGRLVATLDIDGLGILGRAGDAPAVGGRSPLDDWTRAIAETQGRARVPDLAAGWESSGGVEDARLLFLLGVKMADAPLAPSRPPGDEAEAARLRALAELRH
jgi:hypothetical protein